MTTRTYVTTLVRNASISSIPVPFDPKPVFGKTRAPVNVTLNGYTYRSTIAAMGGKILIPLRKSHKEAAGLQGDETLEVTLALDSEPRIVEIPEALAAALDAPARKRWDALSFSDQKERAEAVLGAKKDDTRRRRIRRIVAALRSSG